MKWVEENGELKAECSVFRVPGPVFREELEKGMLQTTGGTQRFVRKHMRGKGLRRFVRVGCLLGVEKGRRSWAREVEEAQDVKEMKEVKG